MWSPERTPPTRTRNSAGSTSRTAWLSWSLRRALHLWCSCFSVISSLHYSNSNTSTSTTSIGVASLRQMRLLSTQFLVTLQNFEANWGKDLIGIFAKYYLTRPVASVGQGGQSPKFFLCPSPHRFGLSFRIFVCIHLLCEINVQYMYSPWLF